MERVGVVDPVADSRGQSVDLMRLNQDFSVIVNHPAIWEMEQGRKRAAEAKKAWKRGATISVQDAAGDWYDAVVKAKRQAAPDGSKLLLVNPDSDASQADVHRVCSSSFGGGCSFCATLLVLGFQMDRQPFGSHWHMDSTLWTSHCTGVRFFQLGPMPPITLKSLLRLLLLPQLLLPPLCRLQWLCLQRGPPLVPVPVVPGS